MILDKWADGFFTIIVTTDIVAEYFEVLNRPKFRLKPATIERIGRYIYQFAEFIVSEESIQAVASDPQDDKFIEAAVTGSAEFIVSGDSHLLELKRFRATPILTAREFLDWLENEEKP